MESLDIQRGQRWRLFHTVLKLLLHEHGCRHLSDIRDHSRTSAGRYFRAVALRARAVQRAGGLLVCAPATTATDRSKVRGLSLPKRLLTYLLSLLTITGPLLISS
jgi:hypothetical protein